MYVKGLRWLLTIGAMVTVVFFLNNHFFSGSLESPRRLGKELRTPQDSLYQYKLVSQPPFQYRVLFPATVKATHHVLFDKHDSKGFYYVYKFWSWFFLLTSACLLFYLLWTAGFDTQWSFIGTCIYLFLPPTLLAYTIPVHTREDTLGYSILFGGLLFMLTQRWWYFLLVSLLGVFCRETLLLLPLLYLLYSDDKNWARRLFISAVPVAGWVLFRLSMGYQNYDVLEGFKWNIRNTAQVIAFLFITFNMFWIPVLLYFMGLKNKERERSFSFFYRSYIVVFAVLFLTTYLGGIFNEIRLLYLFSPWIIVISLNFLKDHWAEISAHISSKKYGLFIILSALFWAFIGYLIVVNRYRIIEGGRFDVSYHTWIAFFVFYAYLTTIFLPPCIKVFFNKIKG